MNFGKQTKQNTITTITTTWNERPKSNNKNKEQKKKQITLATTTQIQTEIDINHQNEPRYIISGFPDMFFMRARANFERTPRTHKNGQPKTKNKKQWHWGHLASTCSHLVDHSSQSPRNPTLLCSKDWRHDLVGGNPRGGTEKYEHSLLSFVSFYFPA